MFNLREVNYLRFTQKFRYPSKKLFGITLRKGLFYGVCNYFISFLLSFFRNPFSFNHLIKKSRKNIIFYSGRNQYNALISFYECMKIKEEDVVMIKASELPIWRSYVYAIRHVGSFWQEYFKASSEDRKIIANEFATFRRSYGDYDFFQAWLHRAQIKRVILASDISPLMRSFILACRDSNVITAYIQHASVTDKFPPLITTYAFLDGEDAFEKYRLNKRISSDVYLIGGARFDLAKPSTEEVNKKVIGIALTMRDEKDCWEKLVKSIRKTFPDHKIVLRPHPRMEKGIIKQFCDSTQIEYSDPLIENSFSFLVHIGILIANETSTHLDAMIMHRPTVLYSGLSSLGLRDHYGMIKKGLLKHCSSFEELTYYLNRPSELIPNMDVIRYYNASYLTIYEFNVSELIVRILLEGSDNKGLIVKDGIKYIDYASKG